LCRRAWPATANRYRTDRWDELPPARKGTGWSERNPTKIALFVPPNLGRQAPWRPNAYLNRRGCGVAPGDDRRISIAVQPTADDGVHAFHAATLQEAFCCVPWFAERTLRRPELTRPGSSGAIASDTVLSAPASMAAPGPTPKVVPIICWQQPNLSP
jgi:hypothetical protein